MSVPSTMINYQQIFLERYPLEFYKKLGVDLTTNKQELDRLIEQILKNEETVSFRASWVLCHACDHNNKVVIPYIDQLLDLIPTVIHNGTIRSILRCIAAVEPKHIPQSSEDALLDLCFGFLENSKEEVAVRVHAMQCISNYIPKYPELKNDFTAILEIQLQGEGATTGFKNRARKLIKKFREP